MNAQMRMSRNPRWRRVRWLVWGGAACLLLSPWIAMRFTTEVDWTALDFAVMGAMLGSACIAFEVALHAGRSHAYVAAAGVAVAAAFLTTWSNLAVGIIRGVGHPANLVFFGVVAIALAGTALSRLRPRALARAMDATALAQGLACILALVLDGILVFAITVVLLAMWLVSGRLFRRAAREAGPEA